MICVFLALILNKQSTKETRVTPLSIQKYMQYIPTIWWVYIVKSNTKNCLLVVLEGGVVLGLSAWVVCESTQNTLRPTSIDGRRRRKLCTEFL